MAVTLTQLSAFVAVARRGSVTAAAQELVVTQPSVSAAVSALERELGVRLTERSGRNIALTAAGRTYLPYAVDVLGLLDRGTRAAKESSGAEHPTLRVSAVTTAGEQLAPLLIQAFRAHRPELGISLDVGNRATVFARLRSHAVDVAITGRVPEASGLHGERFADNEIVLITAADDPLARRRWVAVEELAPRPWLVREQGSGTRAMCEEFLAAHGAAPELLTLGSNGAIRQAARAGLGVALISRAAVALELEHRLLGAITVRGGLPKRSWYVVRPESGPVPDAVTQFTRFLRSDAARRVITSGP